MPNAIHVTNNGTGTSYLGVNMANSSTFSGPITLDKTTTLVAAPGGTVTFSNTISGGGGVGGGRGRLHRHRGPERLDQLQRRHHRRLRHPGPERRHHRRGHGHRQRRHPDHGARRPSILNLIAGDVTVNAGGVLGPAPGTPLNMIDNT